MAKKSLFIENAVILSKIDELIAKFDYEKSKYASELNKAKKQGQTIVFLEKELEELKKENSALLKRNNKLENELMLGQRIKEQQDFQLSEKIAKIVDKFEGEDESGVVVWNGLIDTLINDIDETINLLRNK